MAIVILAFVFFAVVQLLDVYTTKRNNPIPEIFEANKRYRLPDGKADIKKLFAEKLIFIGVIAVAVYVCISLGAGILAMLPPITGALVIIPVVLKNNKLYNKYK